MWYKIVYKIMTKTNIYKTVLKNVEIDHASVLKIIR